MLFCVRVRNFRRFSFWANSTTEKSHLVLNSVAFGFADYKYHPVTRGGTAKPVVLLTHGGTRLRYFSVTEAQHRIAEGEYIAYTSLDDTYPERLAETTAWMLGALVLGVANDANGAKTAEARAMEILSAL